MTPSKMRKTWMLVLATTLLATVAYATTKSECEEKIAEIRTALDGVDITGNRAAQNEAGLRKKLDDAENKLDNRKGAKCGDAIQKLWDFSSKVDELASAGKMVRDDADELMGLAEAAIECIVDLEAGICLDGTTP